MSLQRILVVGVTGSGKTTTAKKIAEITGLPRVELDELFWGPNWQRRPTEVFRTSVAAALAGHSWVACGNYHGKLKDLTWHRADTIVWLDLPNRHTLSQLVFRTLRRIVLGQSLWHGNRETLRNVFFDKESLLVWWWQVTRMEPQRTLERVAQVEAQVFRFRTRREVARFLERLSGSCSP